MDGFINSNWEIFLKRSFFLPCYTKPKKFKEKNLKNKVHLFFSVQRVIYPQKKTIIEENKKRRGDIEMNVIIQKIQNEHNFTPLTEVNLLSAMAQLISIVDFYTGD